MAFTQSQLDALKAAYASGTTRVTYEGKTIEYRSLAEMEKVMAKIEAEVVGVEKTRVRRVLLSSRRGL